MSLGHEWPTNRNCNKHGVSMSLAHGLLIEYLINMTFLCH